MRIAVIFDMDCFLYLSNELSIAYCSVLEKTWVVYWVLHKSIFKLIMIGTILVKLTSR